MKSIAYINILRLGAVAYLAIANSQRGLILHTPSVTVLGLAKDMSKRSKGLLARLRDWVSSSPTQGSSCGCSAVDKCVVRLAYAAVLPRAGVL